MNSNYYIYTVLPTDTWQGIALRNQTTITHVKKLNTLTSELLFPGQKLKLPLPSSPSSLSSPSSSPQPPPYFNPFNLPSSPSHFSYVSYPSPSPPPPPYSPSLHSTPFTPTPIPTSSTLTSSTPIISPSSSSSSTTTTTTFSPAFFSIPPDPVTSAPLYPPPEPDFLPFTYQDPNYRSSAASAPPPPPPAALSSSADPLSLYDRFLSQTPTHEARQAITIPLSSTPKQKSSSSSSSSSTTNPISSFSESDIDKLKLKNFQNASSFNSSSSSSSSSSIHASTHASMLARYHRHPVTHEDTLQGVALRYGVSPAEVKRINRMPTDEVYAFSCLLIPVDPSFAARLPPPAVPDPERTRRFQRAAFRKKTLASEQEADAYLRLADGDFKEAHRLWLKDHAWEQQRRDRPIHPLTFRSGIQRKK